MSGAFAPSLAQQSIDEPRLDPIFGKSTRDSDRRREAMNDDELYDSNWSPVRGFIGLFTFLTPETTNISVGVGPVYRPDYFGSDDYEWAADPAVFVRFKNFLFFDDDGADLALFGFSRFSFGPSIRIVGARKEDDNPALQGLGKVGTTLELGAFAATTFFNRYSVRFKIRQGAWTGHRGLIVDAQSTALLFRVGRVSTAVSAHASWVGDRYADAYFSITPEQSLASGLPVHDADAGFRNFGGSLNGYLNVGKRWSLNPYVSYSQIIGDFADTPIIRDHGSRHQFRAGFHLMREFTFGD